MKKIIFLGCLIVLSAQAYSFAEIIYLKNGEKIISPVLQKTDDYIIVSVDRFVKKLNMSEIDKIEEPLIVSDQLNIDPTLFPTISQAKVNLIVKLMEATGTIANLRNNFQKIIDKAPQEKKKEFFGMFNISEIVTRLIPIYDKYYEESELEELLKFNESPLGKKIIDVTPKILAETLQVSIAYFKEKKGATP